MRVRRGYSLIEFVLMMGIVGVLMAIAAPRFGNSLALYRVQQAAQRVAADVNLAQWQAKISSAGQTIVYSPNSNSYSLTGVAALAGGGSTYQVNLSNDPYRATMDSATFGAGSTLSFDRYGQPAAGGTVVIHSGGYSSTITVDANTGKATVQ